MAERAPEFTRSTTPERGRAATIREEVRRGLEARPEAGPAVAPPAATSAQKASLYSGAASLGIGVLAFAAPLVTGNRDRVINTHNGKLLGVFAVNPPHALVHAGLGVWGILARRSDRSAQRYLRTTAAAYTALGAAGFLKGRGRKGIYEFMGMALNTADNWLHAAWAGASTLFAARPRLGQGM